MKIKPVLLTIFVLAGLLAFGGLFVSQSRKAIPVSEKSESLVNADSAEMPTKRNITQELLNLPLRIFLISDRSRTFSTNRNNQDVERVIREVNKIWSQADIAVDIENIIKAEIESKPGWTTDELQIALRSTTQHDSSKVSLYFVRTLGGSNGMAFTENNMMLVADYTTVNDFRATAHELGHILGLNHTSESQERLMYRGVNGTRLSEAEVQKAREHVQIEMPVSAPTQYNITPRDVPVSFLAL